MKIIYFSVAGQTRRFIQKSPFTNTLEITPLDPFKAIKEPFILITPTYEREITDPVFEFLAYEENARYCMGLVGTGNRNFAELFIFTAKDLAKEFQLPILYSFEFSGTTRDIEKLTEVVEQLESQTITRSNLL
ncbi:class Ib ribonucleoside-diphosphate reductase assembly flavoprotein NrdI [Enterococcus timonensis]|uniref:class Ib ribonucleoside-diphosphate reductase assembly flavoprotein NrdI n=1 Tax=Enterococcus timonensis TaxID=1852364 RepID=UPI0008DB2CB6|nr:class Ib ribonucleoside-diphosphate reductase assembly flavoprotein NrdI [Enterococcus timonensis]